MSGPHKNTRSEKIQALQKKLDDAIKHYSPASYVYELAIQLDDLNANSEAIGALRFFLEQMELQRAFYNAMYTHSAVQNIVNDAQKRLSVLLMLKQLCRPVV